MTWIVTLHRKAEKQLVGLPESVLNAFKFLLKELEIRGPIRGNWDHYGALSGELHHCHVKKGRPTYVAVWRIIDKKERQMEVVYVDTHEGAPYQKH